MLPEFQGRFSSSSNETHEEQETQVPPRTTDHPYAGVMSYPFLPETGSAEAERPQVDMRSVPQGAQSVVVAHPDGTYRAHPVITVLPPAHLDPTSPYTRMLRELQEKINDASQKQAVPAGYRTDRTISGQAQAEVPAHPSITREPVTISQHNIFKRLASNNVARVGGVTLFGVGVITPILLHYDLVKTNVDMIATSIGMAPAEEVTVPNKPCSDPFAMIEVSRAQAERLVPTGFAVTVEAARLLDDTPDERSQLTKNENFFKFPSEAPRHSLVALEEGAQIGLIACDTNGDAIGAATTDSIELNAANIEINIVEVGGQYEGRFSEDSHIPNISNPETVNIPRWEQDRIIGVFKDDNSERQPYFQIELHQLVFRSLTVDQQVEIAEAAHADMVTFIHQATENDAAGNIPINTAGTIPSLEAAYTAQKANSDANNTTDVKVNRVSAQVDISDVIIVGENK